MVNRLDVLSKIIRGNFRTAIFAITSVCNCRCEMCSMYKQEPRFMSLHDAKKTLDFLKNNRFMLSYFTGGEPTLHPDIDVIIKYANDLGLATSITTNGTVSRKKLKRLRDAGLYALSVSLDYYEPELCEKIRGHKGIFYKALDTIEYAKELGLKVYTLTYLNPQLLNDEFELERMIKFVNNHLRVPFGFCYPTSTSGDTTYGLNGDENTKDAKKMTKAINKILRMMREGSIVANPVSYIQHVIKFTEGEKTSYTCKGGEHVCYVDWLGDFYPCFNKKKLFNVLRDKPKMLRGVECNECLINCFLEPSIPPQMFNLNHAVHEIAKKVVYKSSLSLYI